MKIFPSALVASILAVTPLLVQAETYTADICIFGGTSGGLAAAIQAARMGRTVVIAEPSQHVGGLTTGGLGATDIGNKAAIGGIAREFYERIFQHYSDAKAWNWVSTEQAAKSAAGQDHGKDPIAEKLGRPTRWTFEPKVASKIYADMLAEAKLSVLRGERLASVKKNGARIVEFTTEKGDVFRAKMFIDATYEGDLMAKAGVSFHVGREANATYGETLNGVRANTPSHQFTLPVDPYVKPGDATSGLLPFIQPGDGGKPGDGDACVQAYNFRLCMTKVEANRTPWVKPEGYKESDFELLARHIEAHEKGAKPLRVGSLMNPVPMPNGKTDTNNNGAFSTDFIGRNYDYPNADYATRERIAKEHENYIRGFLYFLSTSERVPQRLRDEINAWGLAKDEFTGTANFPPQMYVREARRMISDYVMTESDCRWKRKAEDAVGLGAYNMDSHNCQRLVKNGHIENEGDVQVGVKPYPISYRSIVPKRSECENLFVPVCLAASHIAYGSIRMEPVFMILGQSSATAASIAIDAKSTVQDVDYAKLRERLEKDGQVLSWSGPAPQTEAAPAQLDGIVLDDEQAEHKGEWTHGSIASSRRVGSGYVHDNNAAKGQLSMKWTPEISEPGEYEIIVHFPPNPNRATNVPVTVTIDGKAQSAKVNERATAGQQSLGKFKLPKGKGTTIELSNEGTDGHVVADGVQLLKR